MVLFLFCFVSLCRGQVLGFIGAWTGLFYARGWVWGFHKWGGYPVLAQNHLFSTVFHILPGKHIALFFLSILGTVYGGSRGFKERYEE